MLIKNFFIAYITLNIIGSAFAQTDLKGNQNKPDLVNLPEFTIMKQKTANQRPVTTYESLISNLDFDPRVDMQSRNMAEAQGDLSIRGGTFENTGIQVGSATLLDPQTGHYTTELPIAPEMLGEPNVHTGADNALRGFNSSVGTVSYSWSEIIKRGSLTVGGGDHNLNFQRIHNAITGAFGDLEDWKWGAEIESSRSESDGTIPFGDHSFERTSSRLQLLGPDSQTDIFAGHQEKFFGWPGMYTADINNHETEDLQTRLFHLNHQQEYDGNNNFEISSYYRRNTDHFELGGYEADHEAQVSAISLSGNHYINENFLLNYFSQFTADKMIQTSAIWGGTSIGGLDQGPFTARNYYKLSLLPEYLHQHNQQETISIKAGASFDDTNRDQSKILPIFEVSWIREDTKGNHEKAWFSYAESSQVLGYGAIGGSTTGRFASDPNLGRGISKNLEFGYTLQQMDWRVSGSIFKRWDKDLVDWTFEENSTSSRFANHVDIDTVGFEIFASRQWNKLETSLSYAYLKKDEDYKDEDIYGSFYALNFPEHRATLAFIFNPIELLEIRLDNEWRKQRENILRIGPQSTYYSHISASYYPSQFNDLEIFVSYEKPWDEDFQDVPGTPGRGDQFSLGGSYNW